MKKIDIAHELLDKLQIAEHGINLADNIEGYESVIERCEAIKVIYPSRDKIYQIADLIEYFAKMRQIEANKEADKTESAGGLF